MILTAEGGEHDTGIGARKGLHVVDHAEYDTFDAGGKHVFLGDSELAFMPQVTDLVECGQQDVAGVV